jgi:glycerol-3-phosphate acyltransferase PlsY
MKNIDIRQHGSGNVGATNAFRVLGKGPGIAVFVVDFLKGYLPVLLAPDLGVSSQNLIWIGLAAILGHVFNPWLGFKGGKGIATGAGVLMGLNPLLFLIAIMSWIAVFLLTKIVSLSSLIAVGILFAVSLGEPISPHEKAFFGAVFAFVVWTHRSNIRRLLKGEEKRMVSRPK